MRIQNTENWFLIGTTAAFHQKLYRHVLIANMAPPTARLMTCDSSGVKIVAVFVCVGGFARRQPSRQRRPNVVRFATTICPISLFGTRDGNRRPSFEAAPNWMMGTMTSRNWPIRKAPLPILKELLSKNKRTGPALRIKSQFVENGTLNTAN